MLTQKEKSSIIELFKKLVSVAELSEQFKISRQAIYKILKNNNVDIQSYGLVTIKCFACGADIKRHRCRVRKQKNHFCDHDCLLAFMAAHIGPQEMVRFKVSEYFDLAPENIVHFKDGNTINTTIYNLAVFKNQQDHILWHRFGEVNSIWEFGV